MFELIYRSNVLYHGDLEKKAAMDQKRTLGDEAGGSADNAPGTRIGQKSNRREAKALNGKKKNGLVAHPAPTAPIDGKKQGAKITIIRRLKIPEIFIPKAPSPLRDYRTGKVWRPKVPKASPKVQFKVRKSKSDSQLLARKMQSVHRRHSFVGNEHTLPVAAPDVSELVVFSLTHGKARMGRQCCVHCQLSMATILGLSSVFDTLFESDPFEYHITSPFQHLLFTL